MEYTGYEHIVFERKENGVLFVILNRPNELNTINEHLHEELSRVFLDISRDTNTKTVVLTGEGKVFSAGGDIKWMNSLKDSSYKIIKEGIDIIRRLIEVPQPVIARINGHATGLGATIALYCDMIIASDRAKIADPHVLVGLAAGDGGAGIWPMVLGPARAKQYLLTGDPIKAEDALKLGLINEVVPFEELDSRVNYWAERLSNGPQLAIQLTKRSINRHLRKVVDEIVEPSMLYEALTFYSEELKEGVSSFLEKRSPDYNKFNIE
ncbi:enoyl-CoA hydratase/isomerase family protein [Neobacillus mesonae]|uniref:enoyl-CoA hydratase/isomerase family protein n=1 Tax=Neobacillus mesonae TaxID=1193713 RepID=UPI00203E3E25|nr:enoyl-CoA hydratase/isomerase family protein [Neobacillus mesonae]MCM3568247.1 enoyl-CoA hydratase/isomerase family protein [Neobacillus mesonae]